jgi:anhydro-N-acetylmuramic acid kinase
VTEALYVGLMSGTSIDAIDSALVHCGESGISLVATLAHPVPATLADRIAEISHPGDNEIESMGRLDRELGHLFAEAVSALLALAGIEANQVRAIGCHGQTIRHRPPSALPDAASAFTLQIADPNTIAERTGITTVADFRRRDIAAGGEGAPLAPAFHAAAFASEGTRRAIVNIGGIANVSLLDGAQLTGGFDSGPGNTLLDQWVRRHQGERFDRQGLWAASGQVLPALLDRLLADDYFSRSGPRSTGKETFNLEWLEHQLAQFDDAAPADIQATLAELTAASITSALELSGLAAEEVYVCGGGAHNTDLLKRLGKRLPGKVLQTTATLGIDPDWVEAVTFAWLAYRTLNSLAGNAPAVTGAAGERILGAIYPGSVAGYTG